MKMDELIAIQQLGASVIQDCLKQPIDHGGCPEPIGQDGDPELALLLRHHAFNHEIDVGLEPWEGDFLAEIWQAVFYDGLTNPSLAELTIIRYLNRRMAECPWVENC